MEVFFLSTLALTPGFAIAIFFYIQDKKEPEPIKLLAFSFLYGMLSLGISLAVSIPIDSIFHVSEKDYASLVVHAFAVVALIEEVSKFIFVRGILYRDKNFNEPLDGIIYAVMVGMGFATAENLLYVFRGDGGTALLRMFSAIPAHALFAVLMGYWLGRAKFTHHREVLYSTAALLVPTLFHGLYDYFLEASSTHGIWTLSALALIVAFFQAKKAVKNHQEASPFQ